MKFLTKLALLAILIPFLTGCASIVSKSNWPFSVDTSPDGAKVTITNKKGVEVYSGHTPTALKLKSGAGFFSKESYVVSLAMDGYETKKINVECKINGWYFGNLLIGGWIGMLIVDPATGAMFRLDSQGISENMVRTANTTSVSLQILNKNDIPKNWEQHLVKLD